MKGQNLKNTKVVSDNLSDKIKELKRGGDKDILMFGSPTVAHALMEHNLIDDYWIL